MSATKDLLDKIIGKLNASVKTEAQTLTEAQKAQARTNVGAASQQEVNRLSDEIAAIGTQDDIVQQVIAALGTPVFGRVDADNNIILTGELVDGTYTIKYEDAEGNVTEIGGLTRGEIEKMLNITWSRMTTINSTTGAVETASNDRMSVSNEYALNPDAVYTIKNLCTFASGYYCSVHAYWYSASGFVGRTHLTASVTDNRMPKDWTSAIEPMAGATKVRLRLNYADADGANAENFVKFYETI